MALQKEITLDNGIIVKYHRIVNTSILVNDSITIEVGSYINDTQRNKEKQNVLNPYDENDINIFINTTFIDMPYKESITIEEAYDYLKTLDMFKDATDV